MQLVEPSRKTEIGELDMTTAIKQDIVRFDVTRRVSMIWLLGGLSNFQMTYR